MKILILILLLFGQPLVTADKRSDSDANWKLMLSDVRVRYTWSVKLGAYITRARFGPEVQQLDGALVTLKGFFLAADLTGDLYVLSTNPMATCFFCSAAGIETVVEMEPHPDDLRIFKRLKTDDFVVVEGRLMLNPDDYSRLVYILKEAKVTGISR